MPDATAQDLEDIVQTERFDMIGFSVANERWLEPLTPLIARLRAISRNGSVRVMVGGRVFSENPDRVAMVGADQTAVDARDAVETAARLFDHQTSAA
jgi:methanogenic corrinoid protein MtbC1